MEKLCPDCQTSKPTTEFHKDRSKSDGLNLYCKPCMITRQKAYAMRPPRHQAPEGMKRCSRCKETKPLESFGKQSRRHDGLDRTCKGCRYDLHESWRTRNLDKAAAHGRKWRAENKERFKDHMRKQHYDLPMGEFAKMLEAQGGKCAICPRTKALGRGSFHVDHCHDTGKIRGLLCHHCNIGLGHFSHSTEHLALAIQYLNRTST